VENFIIKEFESVCGSNDLIYVLYKLDFSTSDILNNFKFYVIEIVCLIRF
jgi:hypothetical protein